MKIEITRGTRDGQKFCEWKIDSYESMGRFVSDNDYSALTGHTVTASSVAPDSTRIRYGDSQNIFNWSMAFKFSGSSEEIAESLQMRRTEIRKWIATVDVEEKLEIEIV